MPVFQTDIDAYPPDRERLRERRLAELRKEAERLRFTLEHHAARLTPQHVDQLRAQLAATEAMIERGGWPASSS